MNFGFRFDLPLKPIKRGVPSRKDKPHILNMKRHSHIAIGTPNFEGNHACPTFGQLLNVFFSNLGPGWFALVTFKTVQNEGFHYFETDPYAFQKLSWLFSELSFETTEQTTLKKRPHTKWLVSFLVTFQNLPTKRVPLFETDVILTKTMRLNSRHFASLSSVRRFSCSTGGVVPQGVLSRTAIPGGLQTKLDIKPKQSTAAKFIAVGGNLVVVFWRRGSWILWLQGHNNVRVSSKIRAG